MQFLKLSVTLLTLISTATILESISTSTRWNRFRERADIKKDKAVNELREKTLDLKEKADELKDKARENLERRKQRVNEWKERTKRKVRHNYNKALDDAKVEE